MRALSPDGRVVRIVLQHPSRKLLAQAKALREAQEIRAYVSVVRDRQATLVDPLGEAGFQDSADGALSQADRIDPVLSGSFTTVQVDD